MATRFFHHHLGLFLSLRGRYNYLNFERYGRKNELTYRNHHESGFDFGTFNRLLIVKYTASRRMIAFDPSYIAKSGKAHARRRLLLARLCGQGKMGP